MSSQEVWTKYSLEKFPEKILRKLLLPGPGGIPYNLEFQLAWVLIATQLNPHNLTIPMFLGAESSCKIK